MYTICVAALKGGVGKTTTATNIAYLLSKSNRVLFADADCQGDSSKVFGEYQELYQAYMRLFDVENMLHKTGQNYEHLIKAENEIEKPIDFDF